MVMESLPRRNMFLKKYLGAHKLAIFLCSVLFVFQAVFSLSVPYFMGEMIEVKLFRPLNGTDYLVGQLTGYADGKFTIHLQEQELELAVKDARLIRPWIDFSKS